MIGPLKLKLEYLASTYGIENLGLAWIQTNVDGSRSLVLQDVPEKGVVQIIDKALDEALSEDLKRQLGVPTPELLAMYPSTEPARTEPLTRDELEFWLPEEVTG